VRATVALLAVGLTVTGGAGGRPVALVVSTGTDSRLLLSTNGQSWRDATPSPPPFAIDDVQFVDARHGFATTGDCIAARETVHGTSDAGRTWRRLSGLQGHSCNGGTTTAISFVDARRGWSTWVEPTGPGAQLSRTTNGGRSWTQVRADLPLPGVVRFRTASDGWLTHIFRWPAPMYETRDGGHRFRARRVARPTGVHGVAAYESPIFFGRVGVLATRWEPTGGSRDRFDVDAFYRTSDGGRTWALASKLRLQPASDLRVVSPSVWWLASRNAVYLTTTAGRRWARHAFRLGFRPLELSLTPVGARSAVLQTYNEPNRMRWFVTHDGGATFDRFTP
jgi:photosystem II stability/assembly factor-like uncharacterized protein